MNQTDSADNDLKGQLASQVPSKLWSQHDADIGLVMSATPICIRLKPGERLPRKPQYPLKAEGFQGIGSTLQGLINAGVVIRTASPCNTPILPEQKADRQKWRLVHDLR